MTETKTQKPQPAISVTKLSDHRFLLTGIAPPHCLNSHSEPASNNSATEKFVMLLGLQLTAPSSKSNASIFWIFVMNEYFARL